jgi:hypothetical protein
MRLGGRQQTQIFGAIAETAPNASTRGVALRYPARARRVRTRPTEEVRSPMFAVVTAPAGAVVFLFVLSFLCFMSGAVLRRWPDRVQAYIERVDGSLWFVTPETHRALIHATGFALTALSLLALIAARIVS